MSAPIKREREGGDAAGAGGAGVRGAGVRGSVSGGGGAGASASGAARDFSLEGVVASLVGGFLTPTCGPVEFQFHVEYEVVTTDFIVRIEWPIGSSPRIDFLRRKPYDIPPYNTAETVVGTRPLTRSNSAVAAAWICNEIHNVFSDDGRCYNSRSHKEENITYLHAKVSFHDLPSFWATYSFPRDPAPTDSQIPKVSDANFRETLMLLDYNQRMRQCKRQEFERQLLELVQLWKNSDPVF